MSALTLTIRQTSGIGVRHVRALLRQPAFVMITLVQPVIWLLLFGQLFKSVARLPGFTTNSYIEFLTPGIVVMNAMFSNGWSGMSVINDLDRGVMNRFLVSPVSRGAITAGHLANSLVTTLVQSLIIIGLGLLAGARFHGGFGAVLLLILAALLLGAAFATFSDALGLLMRKEESMIAAVTFLVLPMSFLSTLLMPSTEVTPWIRDVAAYNPVNWAVEVGRQSLNLHPDWGFAFSRLGFLALLCLACLGMAVRAFRSYQKSV
jgi:ABC-2 type transport system permease protein